jgi:leucyl-tRNA synthetase
MELVNAAYKEPHFSRREAESLVLMLAPYAPHLSEELWEKLGHQATIAYAPWPKFDPALTEDDQVTISVQVGGKLRGTLQISATSDKEQVLAAAKALESVQRHIEGKTLVKEIFVPGKIVNFVVR